MLRTPWGRSEAFADLALDDTSPLPAVDGSAVEGDGPPSQGQSARRGDLLAVAVQLPARIRYGRRCAW